jgi:hypothetical protein
VAITPLLTNDSGQLDNPAASRAIRDSGMHHIRYQQDTRPRPSSGLNGLGFAMGAVLAAIRLIVAELEQADAQRLVLIRKIATEDRYTLTDPRTDPPPYWPSKSRQATRGKRGRH